MIGQQQCAKPKEVAFRLRFNTRWKLWRRDKKKNANLISGVGGFVDNGRLASIYEETPTMANAFLRQLEQDNTSTEMVEATP